MLNNMQFFGLMYLLLGIILTFLMDFILHLFDNQEYNHWIYAIFMILLWPFIFVVGILVTFSKRGKDKDGNS